MRNAFADEVTQLALEDARVMLLSGDIGNRLFDKLRLQSPERFLNCGIAEQNMMGVAAGLGLSGLRPIVYTITPFTTTRCLEQIKISVAYHESPVVIVGTGSGLSYASLGPTHHSLEDFAILRAIPNMQIFAPWDAPSLRSVLRQAIASGKPSYIRIGKKGEAQIAPHDRVPVIGDGLQVRSGSDVCLIAVGTLASEAISAAEQLSKKGISAAVVLVHTVKPFPRKLLIKLAASFNEMLIVEEHAKLGGLGEQAKAELSQRQVHITSIGADDVFMPVIGSQRFARKYFGIDADSIAKTAYATLRKKKS